MRVAFVHDWLVSYRGGERVLEALLELYPEAPVFTLFYDPHSMPESIRSRDIRVSPWLNAMKGLRKILLPILPSAVESMPLEDYDLIISTSSCVAKGVMVGPESKHICYIHSPMRYIWDQRQHYLVPRREFSPREFLIHLLSERLRIWDVSVNHRVDRFVANSEFVRKRVQRYYGRDAAVIHPPVDVARFQHHKTPSQGQKEGYLLAAGAFVAYKRYDLAIAACESLKKKLIIAGSGPEEAKLRSLAGAHTQIILRPSAEQWVQLFQGADAFLFPGIEDFGITAIEAMASGTPVIAFKAGGALDFIIEGKTGLFFSEANAASLAAQLRAFDPQAFSAEELRAYAEQFQKAQFLKRIKSEISMLLGEKL